MKKILLSLAFGLLATASAFAIADQVLPTGGGFYEGTLYQPRKDADTNTCDTTLYAPRFIGELLLGKESGSNALWVARGMTTNDWGLITAESGPFGNANITDLAATKLLGNIPVARMTNGAGTLGGSIGGNIPLAAHTNALASAGSTIGGNIPVAANTNWLAIGGYTIPQTNIVKIAGWTNSFVTAFSFTGGTGVVVMTTTAYSSDGLSVTKGSSSIVTNSY